MASPSKFHDPGWRRERARIAGLSAQHPEYRAERKTGALERAIADALPTLSKVQRERLASLLRGGGSDGH